MLCFEIYVVLLIVVLYLIFCLNIRSNAWLCHFEPI